MLPGLIYALGMKKRGMRFSVFLATAIFAVAIPPGATHAADYTKSHCKLKERGFSSTPVGDQGSEPSDPEAAGRYNTSIGAVLRNPKSAPGVNLTGYIDLFAADGSKIERVDTFYTSTPFYVPAKGQSYLTANIETAEQVTRVRIIVRCQAYGMRGKRAAPPGKRVSGKIVSREDGKMTATGIFTNRGKTRDFGQPTIIFKNARGKIVGGYGCRSCPQTIGLLIKGDSDEWSVKMPDIPQATRAQGIVKSGPAISHWHFA